jgi:hypothetical protein
MIGHNLVKAWGRSTHEVIESAWDIYEADWGETGSVQGKEKTGMVNTFQGSRRLVFEIRRKE